jgi:predicted O-methyltransferase YrrM
MATLAGPGVTGDARYDVSGHEFGCIDIDLTQLGVVRTSPAWLTTSERLLLFTLIYSLRPQRYLEIGVLSGGASLIVAKAMDAVPYTGRLVLVDLAPEISDSLWKQIEHRSVLVTGRSPGVLAEAAQAAGGPFDFVLIDASHDTAGVLRDVNGVVPFLAEGACVLFHDSFRRAVSAAIDIVVWTHASAFLDFGLVTREFTRSEDKVEVDGTTRVSCGFRLLRYRRPSRLARYIGRSRRFSARVSHLVRAVGRRTGQLLQASPGARS